MIISYQGLESLKLQFGDTVVSYNPPSSESKFKLPKFGADIVLISTNHPDMNGAENAKRGDREPVVIAGPGEYEVGGTFVRGFHSKSKYDQSGGNEIGNTIYVMNLEGMNLCFLGALAGAGSIDAETTEALDDIDILFVPIGGDGVLSPAEAYKVAVKIEPRIIIPIHLSSGGAGADIMKSPALKTFLKEGGEEDVKPIDKLTIKKKDLEGKEGDIVLLRPTSA